MTHVDHIDGTASRWPRLPASGAIAGRRSAAGIRADLAAADSVLAQRAARSPAPAPDETRLSDILHAPGDAPAPRRKRARRTVWRDASGDGLDMRPAEPTRADEHAAADRRLRGRDAARVAVPQPPPIATHESVQAEHRSERAASRLHATVERWRDRDGTGLDMERSVPARETERALDPRPERQTPRGVPDYLLTDPATGARLSRFRSAADRGRGQVRP